MFPAARSSNALAALYRISSGEGFWRLLRGLISGIAKRLLLWRLEERSMDPGGLVAARCAAFASVSAMYPLLPPSDGGRGAEDDVGNCAYGGMRFFLVARALSDSPVAAGLVVVSFEMLERIRALSSDIIVQLLRIAFVREWFWRLRWVVRGQFQRRKFCVKTIL